MKLTLVVSAVMLFLAGCDPLASRPGGPLRVEFSETTPIHVLQQVVGERFAFTVEGCQAFDLALSVDDGTTVRESDLYPLQEDGVWTVEVPVEALRPELTSCDPQSFWVEGSEGEPVQARLRIRCTQDRRTAESAPRELRYRPLAAVRPAFDLPLAEVVFPLAPGRFGWAANGTEGIGDPQSSVAWSSIYDRPILMKETSAHVWSFHRDIERGFDLTPWGGSADQSLATSGFFRLEGFFLDTGGGVPGRAVDVVEHAGETLVVSSFRDIHGSFTFISSLPSTLPGEASIQRVLIDEEAISGVIPFRGAPAIVLEPLNGGPPRVRRLDGTLVDEISLGDSPRVTELVIEPGGGRWVYGAGNSVYVHDVAGGSAPVEVSDVVLLFQRMTWLANGDLLLHTSTGGIDLYPGGLPTAQPIRVRLHDPSPLSVAPPSVVAVTPFSAGGFAVLTDTGVQLVDGTSHGVVGGSDPLPDECGDVGAFVTTFDPDVRERSAPWFTAFDVDSAVLPSRGRWLVFSPSQVL